jgi:hypothetical protein
MGSKLVSIIIPTYNREREILECISSLLSISYRNFELIVVDNASQDNTVVSIKEKFSNIRIVELNQNLGASEGRNEGIRHAKGEYLCFVDSDNIVDKNFLTDLVKLAESGNEIGFVGHKMYYFNDPKRIWYAGADISLLTSRTRYIGINEIDKGRHDQAREVGHIPNVWLVKKSVIEKIGMIDTDYIMHYEEFDWAMRAKKAGYKIMFCPTAVVYHNIPLPKKSALLGMNDPLCLFLGNYDRYCYITGKWTEIEVKQDEKDGYIKVRLNEIQLPTIGANGFLVRRVLIEKCDIGDYLFDIDVVYELVKQGHDKFAKVRIGIVHLFSASISEFARKQRRRIRDYAYYKKLNLRKYPWGSLSKFKLLKFILYCLIAIPLFAQSLKGYIKRPDRAWFFHPLACWITLWEYVWGRIGGIFSAKELKREGWKQ